jgi:hypothetical protein
MFLAFNCNRTAVFKLLARRVVDRKATARQSKNALKKVLYTPRAVREEFSGVFGRRVTLTAAGKGESTGLTDVAISVGGYRL